MSEYKLSERAYTKIIFHAAKYPHLAVNGVMLSTKTTKGTAGTLIMDVIPLFHQCLYVTPMVEIALMQIEAYAESKNLILAGYYAAAENFYDNTLEKVPGVKIADKIVENSKNACFGIVDNRLMSLAHDRPALKLYQASSENPRWSKTTYTLVHEESTLEAVSALLKRGAMRDIIDFDNHLDNPENDWTNAFLNKDLKQIMAMY